MPASSRPYMGAIPYIDAAGAGCTFRVWAPFAATVCVAGEFNGWSTAANPLFQEGGGYWSADVPEQRRASSTGLSSPTRLSRVLFGAWIDPWNS